MKVAFLMTALDGYVAVAERDMFDKLAERCRSIDASQAAEIIHEAQTAINRMMAIAASKKPDEDVAVGSIVVKGKTHLILSCFMNEVNKICDWADFVRDSARVRHAFAVWLEMVCADNDFAGIEREVIAALQEKMNSYKLISDDFLKVAEIGVRKYNKQNALLRLAATADEKALAERQLNDCAAEIDALVQN